jgi:antitoxin FitA
MERTLAQVLVRNLSDETVARLKERARRKKRSLEQELREIIEGAARSDRSELIAWLDEFRRRQKPDAGPDTLAILRADRARDG